MTENFCDLYKTPFPKAVLFPSGVIVRLFSLRMSLHQKANYVVGTGRVIMTFSNSYEEIGRVYDDWVVRTETWRECKDAV